jgi:hypothetical protein
VRLFALLFLWLTGCNVILGLEPTHRAPPDEVDASSIDANNTTPDGGTDLRPDANPPECVIDSDCGQPTPNTCTGYPLCDPDGVCTVGFAPRDTLCNNWADQCDGAGNCVDCTTSGGCGECCACFNEVCQPV